MKLSDVQGRYTKVNKAPAPVVDSSATAAGPAKASAPATLKLSDVKDKIKLVKKAAAPGTAAPATAPAKTSFLDKLKSGYDAYASGANRFATKLFGGIVDTGNDLIKRGQNMAGNVNDAAEGIQKQDSALGKVAEVGSMVGKNTAEVIRGIGDIFGDIGGAFVPDSIKKAVEDPNSPMAQSFIKFWNDMRPEYKDVIKTLSQKAQDNPEVAGAIKDSIDSILGGLGLEGGAGVVKTAVDEGSVIAKNVAEKAAAGTEKVVAGAKEFADKTATAAKEKVIPFVKDASNIRYGTPEEIASNNTRRTAEAGAKVDATVGKVAQGKAKDIPKFKRGLSTLDTKGVKTFKDLSSTADSKITDLSTKQDALLAKDPTPRKIDWFTQNVGTKGAPVKSNYVDSALKDLQELYDKTGDAKSLAEIQKVIRKGQSTGLTIKEINGIAKQYGSEFKIKAFGKTGEALTSTNASKFENTRKGLKDTFRNLLPDNESKAIDQQITDLYSVRDLSKANAEKVNALSQRMQKPSVLKKIGQLTGKAVDIATGGSIKSMAQELLGLSSKGLDKMDMAEVEKNLPKYLKQINAAMKKDDTGFVNDIVNMLKGNSSKQ